MFQDRKDAAIKLAKKLEAYKDESTIVYALPRGGVVLGVEVAKALNASLDLLIPRKIGHPYNEEFAIAAVTESGDVVADEREVESVDKDWLEAEIENQRKEARRRRETYIGKHKRPSVKGKTAIIVDDGIATGLTMKAAIKEAEKLGPAKIVVAVPVAPRESVKELKRLVDEVIVLNAPVLFMGAIGAYYREFGQVEDDEVVELMRSVASHGAKGRRRKAEGRRMVG